MINITKESGIPLIGCIAFGIIDRGSNLIQVRPSTICNQNCIYCSTASGPKSNKNNFTVELDYLMEEIEKIIQFKGTDMEINIDSVGEPSLYPEIVELVKRCKKLSKINKISMQSNGSLSENKAKELVKAGLDVLNLSINSLDQDLAKQISNCDYDVEHVKNIAKIIIKEGAECRLCPVWLPKLNDEEIPKIINFAKEINATLGIQKYDVYKYMRKAKGVKPVNWFKFYKQLDEWGKEANLDLRVRAKDLGIEKIPRIPTVFDAGEKVQLEVKCKGWNKDQMIAVGKERCVSVNDCDSKEGDLINVKILSNKNNIYLAEMA